MIDFASVSKQYPKTSKTIANKITPEDFTLDCLKRIWRGDTQENITNHYGFSCRESLSNICKALKIPKPKGNYLILLKTCEEEGNQNVAKKTLKHIETCKKNLEHASKLSKTPEAIAKQRQSNKDYYKDHPEKREIISAISKEVWRRCSDIRKAKLQFLAEQPDYVQRASHKLITNQEMNEREKRIAHTFYRDFWNQQPEWKVKFGQTRREVFQEFLNGKLDIKKALEDPEGIK